MDTMMAFAMGEANRGKEKKVFDWDKAAKIIKERNAKEALAGLREDWEFTGGMILENGEPIKSDYTFLSSTWATPLLIVDGEEIECWIMGNSTKYDAKTKWSKSALTVLGLSDAEAEKENEE